MADKTPVSRKDAEYQYYTARLAAAGISTPATTHLVELRKTWHAHKTGNTNKQEHASDLEYNWLGTFAGVTGKTLRDRWEQAYVSVAEGLRVPSTMEELQAMFYMLATT